MSHHEVVAHTPIHGILDNNRLIWRHPGTGGAPTIPMLLVVVWGVTAENAESPKIAVASCIVAPREMAAGMSAMTRHSKADFIK